MKTETPTAEQILSTKTEIKDGICSTYSYNVIEAMEQYASIKTKALEESNKELLEIVGWVADRFGNDYPGSTVGIMGRKAKALIEKHTPPVGVETKE